MRKIKNLENILKKHKLFLEGHKDGKRANLSNADLCYANLRYANLRGANLSNADLRHADLRVANLLDANLKGADLKVADLRVANLKGADLRFADLRDANLRGADLRVADLRVANLRGANLKGANLDHSCFPLWGGSLDMKVDARIAHQLAYHFCRLDCDDEEYLEVKEKIKDFANKFHRASECGEIE